MNKLSIILASLCMYCGVNAQELTTEEAKHIAVRERKELGLIYNGDQTQWVIFKSHSRINSNANSYQIKIEEGSIIGRLNPVYGPQPGPPKIEYPGILSDITPNGNSYLMTCIPSNINCFRIILAY